MDDSKERIEGLRKCVKLLRHFDIVDVEDYIKYHYGESLPRIDQHLKILKEKEVELVMEQETKDEFEWSVSVYSNKSMYIKEFEAYTLEQALDQAVEWVLNQT